MATCLIGTSGWHYQHWGEGVFYPPELSAAGWLAHYARHFDTVEINNTFYHLPAASTFEQWRETAPAGFVFAVKGSRLISHLKKLKEPQAALANFLERARLLGEKLGPVLWQFPPRWKRNPERLRGFLDLLPSGLRCAFEFRDPSWFDDEIYQALADHRQAWCVYDLEGADCPVVRTADWTYFRFHGPGERYLHRYPREALREWAGRARSWLAEGCDCYAYFNNDAHGHALTNARELRELIAAG